MALHLKAIAALWSFTLSCLLYVLRFFNCSFLLHLLIESITFNLDLCQLRKNLIRSQCFQDVLLMFKLVLWLTGLFSALLLLDHAISILRLAGLCLHILTSLSTSTLLLSSSNRVLSLGLCSFWTLLLIVWSLSEALLLASLLERLHEVARESTTGLLPWACLLSARDNMRLTHMRIVSITSSSTRCFMMSCLWHAGVESLWL